MPLDRSPINHGDNVEHIVEYPSARLATVTRKSNEIKCVMHSKNPDVKWVKMHLKKYYERSHELEEACAPTLNVARAQPENPQLNAFIQWYEKQKETISVFTEEVETWLQQQPNDTDDIEPEDSVSNISQNRSRTANKSLTSSVVSAMRAELEARKAKTAADEAALKKKIEIENNRAEEEMIRAQREAQRRAEEEKRDRLYAMQLQQIDLEKRKAYDEIEEKKILQIEEKSNLSSRRSHKSELSQKLKSHVEQSEHSSGVINFNKPAVILNQSESASDLKNLVALVAKNQTKASLPKNELKVFDGSDPTVYWSFMDDFKSMIADCCDSDVDRFHYLQKYTTDLPLELVKSCRSKDPKISYKRALKALTEEYGDERNIASAYIEKLNQFNPINNEDGKSLQKLSIFLKSCNNMIDEILMLNQLN